MPRFRQAPKYRHVVSSVYIQPQMVGSFLFGASASCFNPKSNKTYTFAQGIQLVSSCFQLIVVESSLQTNGSVKCFMVPFRHMFKAKNQVYCWVRGYISSVMRDIIWLVGAQPPPCCSFARHLVGKIVIHCPFPHR